MVFALSKLLWYVVQPSISLPLLIILGVWLASREPSRRLGLRLATTGLTLLMLAMVSPLASAVILPLEQRFPVKTVKANSNDYAGILVLGGAEDGRLSHARHQLQLNNAAERVTEGARLAYHLPTTKIIFSGGTFAFLPGNVAGADTVANWWQAVGIAPSRIVIEDKALNTYENALYMRDILKPTSGQKWLLVTSAAHMPRAVGVYRRAGFDVVAYPVDFRTAGPHDAFRPPPSPSNALQRLDDATKEWAGLIAYWLMGRTSALFPAP